MSNYLDIGKFFDQNFLYRLKTKIGMIFFSLKCFPDFKSQISQKCFFVIWQDGQTPHQLFFSQKSTKTASQEGGHYAIPNS